MATRRKRPPRAEEEQQVRALAVIRLSRFSDASTSPERQRGHLERWAGLPTGTLRDDASFPLVGTNATVVGMATDLGVSGAVSPFERNGLGPWLTEVPPQPWDVLAAWKLDRISRSALDTLTLMEWLTDHGRDLVTTEDGLDTRTSMGRVFVQVSAIFAELERDVIRERILDTRVKLRTDGHWDGSGIVYGLMPEKIDNGRYRLVLDTQAAEVLGRVAGWILDEDASIAECVRRLNEQGVMSPKDRFFVNRGREPRGFPWKDQVLSGILRNPSLLGWTPTTNDDGVREHDSTRVRAPEVLSPDTFKRVNAVLNGRTRTKKRGLRGNASPLAGVAVCAVCGAKLWHRSNQVAGKVYRHYFCSERRNHTRLIRADELEMLAALTFLASFKGVEVTEPVEIPGVDHSDEISLAEMAVDNLTAQLATARSDLVIQRLTEQLSVWDERLVELQATPSTPARVEHRPTGQTWTEVLATLTTEERRDLWRRHGVEFVVSQDEQGVNIDVRAAEGFPLSTESDTIMETISSGTTLVVNPDGSWVVDPAGARDLDPDLDRSLKDVPPGAHVVVVTNPDGSRMALVREH